MKRHTKEINSPIGILTISVNEKAVIGLGFGSLNFSDAEYETVNDGLMNETIYQVEEYFRGRLKNFDLPLEPYGTEFQKKVWASLQMIPYGETRSYRDIALMCDCPKGYRAVGMANNRNPIAVIIPCHRVIGADGSLTGFGGGLESKEFLLGLEKN
ncbi:MAG: methylated-DNA--[protein]-cysteine S-methyltransferase [Lachnospiraceae bacterium]|nr:methylated-DNA--[protein]-cysteine S-methyltransferase [Lachnospiraceae bacterium]